MAIFTKLFHPQSTSAPVAGGVYRERDNRGTRHDSLEVASTYWVARLSSSKKDPFVMYTFERADDARAALLELPCIHEASDTHRLICTEVLTFGYYLMPDKPGVPLDSRGKYEAIVCGGDLNHELWAQAHDSFSHHGGRKKSDLEPPTGPAALEPSTTGSASTVTFLREDRKERMGKTLIYRVHRAPDAASAKAFLDEHPVTQPLFYVIVETPEGTYCRDIEGMYKE